MKPAKQPYVEPRLVTYGDITSLTHNKPTGKKADGGGPAKTRTG